MRASGGASVRDRTAEFQQIVARLQAQQGLPSTSGRDFSGPSASAVAADGTPQSEFARRAGRIGLGIHSTSQKLQKLAQLARRTSMFDDPAEEINELSTVVKQDIQVGACWGGGGGGGVMERWSSRMHAMRSEQQALLQAAAHFGCSSSWAGGSRLAATLLTSHTPLHPRPTTITTHPPIHCRR